MEHKTVELEIAKELTISAIQNGFRITGPEEARDPEAIGQAIAKLYNAILENLKA